MSNIPEQLELFPEFEAYSETTIPEHLHKCECGTWMCVDETCEPTHTQRYGYRDYGPRLCALCEELLDE